MVTAIGARRRLQVLANRGWPASAIGREGLGISTAQASRVLSGTGQADPELTGRVAAAYDALWDREPPQHTGMQRASVRAVRERAERAAAGG